MCGPALRAEAMTTAAFLTGERVTLNHNHRGEVLGRHKNRLGEIVYQVRWADGVITDHLPHELQADQSKAK